MKKGNGEKQQPMRRESSSALAASPPEAKPQGPKVAHCGGTGVCAVLGPFAFSPLAPVCLNMARPNLLCTAGTHQATQL